MEFQFDRSPGDEVDDMILTYQILAIFAQALLLLGIVNMSNAGGRTVFQRLFNPGCWYSFFYILWFLIPQIVSIANDNFVIDYPGVTGQVVLESQLYLVLFNLMLASGLLLVRLTFDFRAGDLPTFLHFDTLRRSETALIIVFYLIGCVATLYLGRQLLNSDGFRSELVKTPSGMIATVLSFFGIFAMAVLVGHSLYNRRFLVTLLAVGLLGGFIFFTGARGRLMWPVVLAVAYVSCRQNRINFKPLIGLAILGFAVLLVFDPVLNSLRGGLRRFDMGEVREKISVGNLFMNKRNFDGFANFTLIVTRDTAPADPNVFFRGGRKTFMEHYYPDIFKRGVGFGTTVPGMLWLGGKTSGLVFGGMAYGGMLGFLGFLSRRIRRESMFWSYLFAMTWLAAVGGNFQESLDKMLAVALPGFVWRFALPRKLRFEPQFEGRSLESSSPNVPPEKETASEIEAGPAR